MIEINDSTITMTKGDTLCAQLTLKMKQSGEPYTPVEGDEIEFEMRRLPFDKGDPALEKSIDTETMMFELEPSDTAELDSGEYSYKMRMVYADGTVDTFIDGARLTLTP